MVHRISGSPAATVYQTSSGRRFPPAGVFLSPKDSLSPMTSFGQKFYVRISAFFDKISFFFTSFIEEKFSAPQRNWENPETFLKVFSRNPSQVLRHIAWLFRYHPVLLKRILINLAEHWKKNPERYPSYERSLVSRWKEDTKGRSMQVQKEVAKGRSMRMQMVSVLEEFFEKLFLTPEQCRLQERIINGSLSNQEVCAMQLTCEKTLSHSPFRREFLALQAVKEKASKLWEYCYGFLQCQEEQIEDLHLNHVYEHLEHYKDGVQRGELTFGHFAERILFFRHIHSLRCPNLYRQSETLVRELLAYLKGATDEKNRLFLRDYPEIRIFVDQMLAVLSDEKKAIQMQNMVLDLVNILDPIKKSPPKQ